MDQDAFGRRVLVGVDDQGRSAVPQDAPSGARTVRPNGALSVEIWRQEAVPAREGDDGVRDGPMAPMPPERGACFRLFTLPAGTEVETAADADAVAAAFGGPENLVLSDSGVLLHRTDSLYVATVVSGRAYLVVGTGEALLGPGDSFVLPGSLHTWRNPFAEPAVMACAVFPYTDT